MQLSSQFAGNAALATIGFSRTNRLVSKIRTHFSMVLPLVSRMVVGQELTPRLPLH